MQLAFFSPPETCLKTLDESQQDILSLIIISSSILCPRQWTHDNNHFLSLWSALGSGTKPGSVSELQAEDGFSAAHCYRQVSWAELGSCWSTDACAHLPVVMISVQRIIFTLLLLFFFVWDIRWYLLVLHRCYQSCCCTATFGVFMHTSEGPAEVTFYFESYVILSLRPPHRKMINFVSFYFAQNRCSLSRSVSSAVEQSFVVCLIGWVGGGGPFCLS